MNVTLALQALTTRGYQYIAPLASSVDQIPEAPGVYVILAHDHEIAHVIGIRLVATPWLRTDIQEYLLQPHVAGESPAIVAFRVIELQSDEGTSAHLRRLVTEHGDVANALDRGKRNAS